MKQKYPLMAGKQVDWHLTSLLVEQVTDLLSVLTGLPAALWADWLTAGS